MSRIIAIYPGRFHPFCPHHYEVYKQIADNFGVENTYIVTSGEVNNTDSPFTFDEKEKSANYLGVPSDYFVEVKVPYRPVELLKNFDSEKDKVFFIQGKKDKGRIPVEKKDGSPGYYQSYKKGTDIKPFKQHAYLIDLDNVKKRLPDGSEMSGTNVRNFLSTADEEEFETVMGYYDEEIHNILKRGALGEGGVIGARLVESLVNAISLVSYNENRSILENKPVNLSHELKRERVDYYFNYISNLLPEKFKVERIGTTVTVHIPFHQDTADTRVYENELLTEGGAIGYLNHPYDRLDLTFGDLKEIIRGALQGKLDFEKRPVEKTDGQNILVTVKDGKIRAARNKNTIKNPMTAKELAKNFDGREDVQEAFSFAIRDLGKALLKISEEKLKEIFKDGKVFISVEIIYPKTKNVVIYGPEAYLQLHGLVEFDENGKKLDEVPNAGETLYKTIKKVNGNVQDTFEIIAPRAVKIGKDIEFDKYVRYFINTLEKYQNEFNLSDDDEVVIYHEKWWEKFVEDRFLKLKPETKKTLVQRWAYNDKSNKILKAMFSSPQQMKEVQDFDKNDYSKIARANMAKFEMLFLELGVRVLNNIDNYLSAAEPKAFVDDIKNQVKSLKKNLKSPEDLAKMEELLVKVKSLGGFDKLVPSEGIVFYYKGNSYKLTGLFAPVNQLLGIAKYSKFI
jgi:hypothetical protein